MDTIISYIDNLFRNYPDTAQVKKAREELLGIMEDKYNELKAEGRSENEAIGIVISEFGNMEEIAAELGLDVEAAPIEPATVSDDRPEKKVTLEQAKNYIDVQDNFGMKIGIGVALCILSPVVSCITDALAMGGFLSENIAEVFGTASLFLMVAVAVGLFITSGIAIGKYDEYKECRITLDYGTRTLITEQYEKYNKVFGSKIALGVALCILSVIPGGIAEELFEGTSMEWLAELMAASLFGFVAVGVFCLITAVIKQGAYEVLLGKGDYSPEKIARKQEEKLIGLIAGIYWPIMVAVYLLWSFITNDWGISWIIWPVAGVLFAAISGIIALVNAQKNATKSI